MKAGHRIAALGGVLVLVGTVSGYLYRVNRLLDLDETFDQRITQLLQAGKVREAQGLVDELNRALPERAVVRLQKMGYHLRLLNMPESGMTAKILRQAGWQKMVQEAAQQRPPERRAERRDCGQQDGIAEVLYVRDPAPGRNADLLPEVLAALGKNSIEQAGEQAGATKAPAPGQRIVVAPGGKLGPGQGPDNPVLFLSPGPQAEGLLGLGGPAVMRKADCRLRGGPDFLPATDPPLSIPILGDIAVYRARPGVETLATIRCEGQDYPALLRLQRKAGPIDMFTFDILRAIVLLRQGDPAQAGKENDGIIGRRPSDLFPYRLSVPELLVPATDVLIQGLVRLVEGGQPSIRLWHHPAGKSTTVVLTSDQDFVQAEQMSVLAASLRNAGASATMFLTAGTHEDEVLGLAGSVLPESWVDVARRLGMDFGAHPYPVAHDQLDVAHIKAHHDFLVQHYGPMRFMRFHGLVWYGWIDPVRDIQGAGYTYDLSYITLLSDSFAGMGYMTGSGLPLRFYDDEGRPTSVIQLATQIDDHADPWIPSGPLDTKGRIRKLHRDDYVGQPLQLLNASAELYHSPLVVNNHPHQFYYDPEWLLSIIEHARRLHAAILNVAEYDDFTGALKKSGYLMTGPGSYRLCLYNDRQDILLSSLQGGSIEPIQIDGAPAAVRHEKRVGHEVAIVTVDRGEHRLSLAVHDRR